MLLTLKAKLLPNAEQRVALLETMERFNEACNKVSDYAFNSSCFSYFKLQRALYKGIREEFKLQAQLTIRCLSKVAESYKSARGHTQKTAGKKGSRQKAQLGKITFRPHPALCSINATWHGGRQKAYPCLPLTDG